jgi:hypothetical protein
MKILNSFLKYIKKMVGDGAGAAQILNKLTGSATLLLMIIWFVTYSD